MIRIRPQTIVRIFLLVAIGGFVYLLLRPAGAGPVVGETAPDFQLSDLGGRKLQLSDYRGKVVLVNFWATWCAPCVAEMPSLNQFQQTYGPKGVVVLAVSEDEDESALRDFTAKYKLAMPVLRDPDRQTSARYQTFKFPETYILDRNGKLLQKVIGGADWSDPKVLAFFNQLTSAS